jgi:hypothetical protein
MYYELNDILFVLQKANVEVVFTKKDGSERKMLCTLNEQFIPQEHKPKNTGTTKKNKDIVSVYDVKKGWRSFNINSVKSVFLAMDDNRD